MITLERITKCFDGEWVLRGIDLQVPQGSVYGIVGLSGAGKSTLLRCINLLERPTQGKVWVGDRELTSLSPQDLRIARREIGMVFQGFNLLSRRTAAENIGLAMELAGKTRGQIKSRAAELLAMVGLTDRANHCPSQLSGGQRQRVGIARALANDPKVLLCDEPTSALDGVTAASILELLGELNRVLGLTIVLITHQLPVVRAICTRVAVIHQGELAEEGTVEAVTTRPKSEMGRRLLHEEQAKLVPGTWRLTFAGETALAPILSGVIRSLNLDVNILAGNIEAGHQAAYGWLLVRCQGTDEQIEAAKLSLEQSGVVVEVA